MLNPLILSIHKACSIIIEGKKLLRLDLFLSGMLGVAYHFVIFWGLTKWLFDGMLQYLSRKHKQAYNTSLMNLATFCY